MDKVESILRHIKNVQDNCVLLAKNLKDEKFGITLIANSMLHDNSKFFGLEYLHLNNESKENTPDLFKLALESHQNSNPHHPEYWESIHEMPKIYLAEFCADIKSRSEELGTDIFSWFDGKATKKWKFKKSDKIYKNAKEFLNYMVTTL